MFLVLSSNAAPKRWANGENSGNGKPTPRLNCPFVRSSGDTSRRPVTMPWANWPPVNEDKKKKKKKKKKEE